MARSIIDIADNSYTQPSPCLDCHWHIQKIDKNRCRKICQKLAAYRADQEYRHLPWPSVNELQNIEEEEPETQQQASKPLVTLQKKEKVRVIMSKVQKVPVKRNEDDIDAVVDKIAKKFDSQQTKIASWKTKTCVICHDKSKPILNKRSQTCASCYQAWVCGKIDHPTLGKFEPSLTKKIIKENVSHKAWQGRDDVAKECTSFVKSRKNIPQQKTVAKKRERQPSIRLYLSRYPKIQKYIDEMAEEMGMPKAHVVLSLLAESIMARRKVQSERCKNY